MLKQFLPFLQKDRPGERNRNNKSEPARTEPQSLECARKHSPPVEGCRAAAGWSSARQEPPRHFATQNATPPKEGNVYAVRRLPSVVCALVLLALILLQATAQAQTNYSINNDWYRGGTRGSTSSNGSANSYLTQQQYWFGRTAGDNVLFYLNDSNGGTVTITDLSAGKSRNYSYYYWVTNTNPPNYGSYVDAMHSTALVSTTNNQDHIYNFTGTQSVNVVTNRETVLRTNVNATTGYTANDHFLISGGTMEKTGAGALNLQVNRLEIINVTGTQGTLKLTDYNTTLGRGTLDSTTVTIGAQGSSTTINSTNYGQTAQGGFSFVSQDGTGGVNRWEIGGHTNPGASTVAGTFTSNGLNNLGYITVNNGTNVSTFNGVTNIGWNGSSTDQFGNAASAGYLHINGTGETQIGTAGVSVFNVHHSDSDFETDGLLVAGTNTTGTSTTYINDVWGGRFVTNASTVLARESGATVYENISNSTRENTGEYIIGDQGTAYLDIFTGYDGTYYGPSSTNINNDTMRAGILNTSGGNVIFGQTAASAGHGTVHGRGSQLNLTGTYTMIVGQNSTGGGAWNAIPHVGNPNSPNMVPGGVSSLRVTDQATVNIYENDGVNYGVGMDNIYAGLIVAQGANSHGYMEIASGAKVNVLDGDMVIGLGDNSIGVVDVHDPGSILSIAGDLWLGYGAGASGILNVYNKGTVYLGGTEHGATLPGSSGSVHVFSGGVLVNGGDQPIADEHKNFAHVYVDGWDSELTVGGLLTVGEKGFAGGFYSDDRYDGRYREDPSDWYNDTVPEKGGITIRELLHGTGGASMYDPTDLLFNNELDVRYGTLTGNAPGLAISHGATVASALGRVGDEGPNLAGGDISHDEYNPYGSNGYVVIDSRDVDLQDEVHHSSWTVLDLLEVGYQGTGTIRVLNGGYLESGSATIGVKRGNSGDGDVSPDYNGGGTGTVYIVGNGAVEYDHTGVKPRAIADEKGLVYILDENDGKYYTTDGNRSEWSGVGKSYLLDENGKYIADTPHGFQSQWINNGPMIVAEDTNTRGTLRINDGAYVETHGLYIGIAAESGPGEKDDARGGVSITGRGSELQVFKDMTDYGSSGPPESKGQGLFSACDYAFVQLNMGAKVEAVKTVFSNGSTLFLKGNVSIPWDGYEWGDYEEQPVFSAMSGSFSVINARIVGNGMIGGEKGVNIIQDDYYTEGQAYIDPGLLLLYDPEEKCESPDYYGTLVFGDQLYMQGNVITRFDVSFGYDTATDTYYQNKDQIIIARMEESDSKSAIIADLSGTLLVHARLVDYYTEDSSFIAVLTQGGNKSGVGVDGKILSMYDTLKMKPERFFVEVDQEIIQVTETRNVYDDAGNITGTHEYNDDALRISMKLNQSPFSDAGNTYNLKQVGGALDEIYAYARGSHDENWLPVLRYFWYIEGDEEFRTAMRFFSGEIRAHSLRLPIQNVGQYIRGRVPEYQECFCERCVRPDPCNPLHGSQEPAPIFAFDFDDPCAANQDLTCAEERLKKIWRAVKKDAHVWGNWIYEQADTTSDGNAFGNQMTRHGVVMGTDKLLRDGKSYVGVMFAYDRGEMKSYLSKAGADDFNMAVYHGTTFRDNRWEWKNHLGMGIQDYTMERDMEMDLGEICEDWVHHPRPGHPKHDSHMEGVMRTNFLGYSFNAGTEVARPFYLFGCRRSQIRPFAGLDINAIWQNAASETGNFPEQYYVALDYHSAYDVRVLGRYGFSLQRDGHRGYIRGGLSHSYLLGGHPYTSVKNQFQYGKEEGASKPFNIRGVNEGFSTFSGNCGVGLYFGKNRQGMTWLNYVASSGLRTWSNTVQAGAQWKF